MQSKEKLGTTNKRCFRLTANTKVESNINLKPVKLAVKRIYRDMNFILEQTEQETNKIQLILDNTKEEEAYEICFQSEKVMEIKAGDELGFVYALLFISKEFLGIQPFWFWNDQMFKKEKYILIPMKKYVSIKPVVKFRGWFVNDEVLIHTWKIEGDKDKPWEMVFEALLRCGGNMTIPGTDKNSVKYRKLASDMGLWITQHHAEPLGAEMFARAYPELNPSFAEHPELFRKLWEKGIEKQKEMKVVWNLGFRGQGDCPFWVNDPRYATDEERGALLSSLIKEQYDLVKSIDSNARCCTNLYGETMELFKDGFLNIPEDIIKIWADNGYGKMVSRRQDNHNPRVNAEPIKDKKNQGIYYHVSFYDLQAANHITLAVNSPEFIKSELENVLYKNGNEYWIINCSNVKPHVYYLDFISKMWMDGTIDIAKHREQFAGIYYGKNNYHLISDCLKDYGNSAIKFGKREDEHAGEQFVNHSTRILASKWLMNSKDPAEELLWATNGRNLLEQIKWYEEICRQGVESYLNLKSKCEKICLELDDQGRKLFEDSIFLHTKIYLNCYQGAVFFCEAFYKFEEKEYQKAFYLIGKAAESYEKANLEIRAREHGKWLNFYMNECLTDIKQTVWILRQLMGFIRNIGDGPHFYKWKRDFLYSQDDRNVMTILVMENHIHNEDLFVLMKARWEELTFR